LERRRTRRAFVDLGGARSERPVALRKDGILFGAPASYRQELRPFTEAEIEPTVDFAARPRSPSRMLAWSPNCVIRCQQQAATADALARYQQADFIRDPILETLANTAASW